MKGKKGQYRGLCLLAAAGMAVLGCRPAAAASPEFARSEEEWARLRDNVLEYEEIGDLIEEYNATVLNNYETYRKDDSGKSVEDYVDREQEKLDALYDAAAMANSDLEAIAQDYSIRMQEVMLQTTMDSAEDSTTKWWQYEKVKKTLTAEAQSMMNSYYQLQYQLEAAQKSRQLLEAQLGAVQRQQSAKVGGATYADVLTAQQQLQNTDAQILSLQSQAESTRQKLIVMLGWSQESTPEIRPMPAVDLNRIAAMNPQADLETACANDYTLMTDLRKSGNSMTDSARQVHEADADNDRQQIAIALETAYQSVLQARSGYEEALVQQDVASRNYQTAQVRQQVGLGTALETLQAESSFVSAQTDVQIKALALFQEMETYDWILKGVRS